MKNNTIISFFLFFVSAFFITTFPAIIVQDKLIEEQKIIINEKYNQILQLQQDVFERDSLIMELESDLMK